MSSSSSSAITGSGSPSNSASSSSRCRRSSGDRMTPARPGTSFTAATRSAFSLSIDGSLQANLRHFSQPYFEPGPFSPVTCRCAGQSHAAIRSRSRGTSSSHQSRLTLS
eukprot:Mycagemm_TRINITY_DN10283_c0_g1::TRINITY_DN10283_c0_g1_i2::g.3908::m.3908 type:complete len:109 gc:universal TRINITY_DN10283_c0_g1_i2:1605-1279(-)